MVDVWLVLLARSVCAGQAAPPALPVAADGPPAPIASEVINRDVSGRATIRAVRLPAPLRIDGKLDEAVYETVPSISDFTQTEAQAGSPATEKTEAWLFFDGNQVYVSFRCWESNPERMVVNEMRRDSFNNIGQNERITWVFDTFYDKRNGVMFTLTPIGARIDAQITDRQTNIDWNPIWD